MNNIIYIVNRNFGKVSDLRKRFPDHVAKVYEKRGVVLMLPRQAANQEMPVAA